MICLFFFLFLLSTLSFLHEENHWNWTKLTIYKLDLNINISFIMVDIYIQVPRVKVDLELGSRLIKNHLVSARTHTLQRNLHTITILQPEVRLAAHTNTLWTSSTKLPLAFRA